MGWLRRLGSTFTRSSMEGELDEEMRFHLEQRTAEYVKQGMPEEEARRAARRRLGNLTLAKEQARDVDTLRWLQDVGRDLRHAGRALRRENRAGSSAEPTDYFPSGYVNRGRDGDGNVMTYEHD